MGCLIWGSAETLSFSIDCAGLWDTTPAPKATATDFTYQNMINLVQKQAWEKLRDVFDTPYSNPTPTKLPAGRLVLYGLGQSYQARLSLDDAHAEVMLEAGKVDVYIHAGLPIGIIIMDKVFEGVKAELCAPDFSSKADADDDADCVRGKRLSVLGYPPAVRFSEAGASGFVQVTGSGAFALLMTRKIVCEKVIMIFTASQGTDEKDALERAQHNLAKALEKDIAVLWQEHCRWWMDFWNRSTVELPSPALEKLWSLANYFLACGSRQGGIPCPLQGVWTADNGLLPPWKGDYHNDLNTQFIYSHYLTANHLAEGSVLFDHLKHLLPQARRFAKEFYGAAGGCYPGVMALDGAALGGWPMYSLSPTNQIWLCQMAWRHFCYTSAPDFLRKTVYPMCQQAGELIVNLLQERGGYLYLPVSTSPEIHEDTPKAWLMPNSNYDLALMRWLFQKLPKLERELELPIDPCWEHTLQRLPKLAVSSKQQLMLASNESLRESHRHFSHTMAIYPLKLLRTGNEADMQIIRQTVEGLEQLGTQEWVGFSFAWMALLQAVCHNGDKAEQYLQYFQDAFIGPNGFHLNGDFQQKGLSRYTYRPFTLEANFLAAEAIQQMLLQTEENTVEIFPALPASWQSRQLSFLHLRTDNGLSVSASKDIYGHVMVCCQAVYAGSWRFQNLNREFSLETGSVKNFDYYM